MEIPSIIFYIFLVVIHGIIPTAFPKKCNANNDIRCIKPSRGLCVDCAPCDPGYQRDRTVKLQWSRKCGHLECYPCRPCNDGFYRMYLSGMSTCSKCVLNCPRLNRLTKTECGGPNKGECGDCLTGFKPGVLNEVSEPCSVIQSQIKKSIGKMVVQPKYLPDNENTDVLTIVLICGIVGFGLAMCGLVFRRYRQRPWCIIYTITDDSLLQSGTRFLNESSMFGQTERDIVADGDTCRLDTELYKLGEMDDFRSDFGESCDDGDMLTIPTARRRLIPESFHDIKVTADDSHIADIAHDLCDNEKVYAFFKYLGINESRYVPQFEHWLTNECDNGKYRQIMLDVLVHWCRKECPNATLYKLVDALMNTELTDISSSLINKYRDEVNILLIETELKNDDQCNEDADGSSIQTDIASQDMLELKYDAVYSYSDRSSIPVEYCDTCDVHGILEAACSPGNVILYSNRIDTNTPNVTKNTYVKEVENIQRLSNYVSCNSRSDVDDDIHCFKKDLPLDNYDEGREHYTRAIDEFPIQEVHEQNYRMVRVILKELLNGIG